LAGENATFFPPNASGAEVAAVIVGQLEKAYVPPARPRASRDLLGGIYARHLAHCRGGTVNPDDSLSLSQGRGPVIAWGRSHCGINHRSPGREPDHILLAGLEQVESDESLSKGTTPAQALRTFSVRTRGILGQSPRILDAWKELRLSWPSKRQIIDHGVAYCHRGVRENMDEGLSTRLRYALVRCP